MAGSLVGGTVVLVSVGWFAFVVSAIGFVFFIRVTFVEGSVVILAFSMDMIVGGEFVLVQVVVIVTCGSAVSCSDFVAGCYTRRFDIIVVSMVVGGTVVEIAGVIVVVVVLACIDFAFIVSSFIVFFGIAHSSGGRQCSLVIAAGT